MPEMPWKGASRVKRKEEPLNGFTGFSTRRSAAPRYGAGAGAAAAGAAGMRSAPLRFDPEKLQAVPETDRRWAWLELDQNALIRNMQSMRRLLGSAVRVLAVVSADAYGHGAARTAKTLVNAGADYLGVATVDEAIELREAYVNAPVLVLQQPPKTAIPLLLGYKIMPTVYEPDFAIQYGEAAAMYGVPAPYHLAVNTGMNRIGVGYADAAEFLRQVGFHSSLDLRGTYTQFATSSSADSIDFQKQYRRFAEALTSIQAAGFDAGIVHCADSAAAIRYPDARFSMVRLGQTLYGLHPNAGTRRIVDLQPVMSVHARITDVRFLPMGESVSYGASYRASGGSTVCTVPIGYADGVPRALSNDMDVLCNGIRCRQAGEICMDMLMFETDARSYSGRMLVDPRRGTEVLLVGRQGDEAIALEDLAGRAGALPRELACAFGRRLPHVYV